MGNGMLERGRKAWSMKVSVQLGHSMNVHVLGEIVENTFGKAGLSQDLGRNWNLQ